MADSVASRICSTCGLCCNGVLFHRVRLQPRDSAKTLAALGIKLSWKKKSHSILQPCPAHQGCQCAIYADRPERCRQFECRMLDSVATHQISEEQATSKIQEVLDLVRQVKNLLELSGSSNTKQSLVVRFQSVLAQPLFDRSDPAATELRNSLINTYARLETELSQYFRTTPVAQETSI